MIILFRMNYLDAQNSAPNSQEIFDAFRRTGNDKVCKHIIRTTYCTAITRRKPKFSHCLVFTSINTHSLQTKGKYYLIKNKTWRWKNSPTGDCVFPRNWLTDEWRKRKIPAIANTPYSTGCLIFIPRLIR